MEFNLESNLIMDMALILLDMNLAMEIKKAYMK